MRKIVITLAGAVGALCAAPAADAQEITVITWGGAMKAAQIESFDKPYQAATGKQIKWGEYNGGLAEVRAQVQAKNVVWDAFAGEPFLAQAGCDEGILEPIDPVALNAAPDGKPATQDFIPGALLKCGAGANTFSLVNAYRCDLPVKPSKIADYFDLAKIPGKRGMVKRPEGPLEWALMADGVATKDVYKVLKTPEGLNRAFAKLDTIKSNIIWYESGSQAPQLLSDGEVVMTTSYNGRIFSAAQQDKKPLCISWDGQYWDMDVWMIPKGSPRKDLALKFIKEATDPKLQGKLSSLLPYGATRISATQFISKHPTYGIDMAPHSPSAPENSVNALQADPDFWTDNREELVKRFNTWVAK